MKRSRPYGEQTELVDVLMLLSQGVVLGGDVITKAFECKTCGRRFESFQALGGHRASHKKPKSSIREDDTVVSNLKKVHECSICGLEFATGQALGGHMRRHRAAGGTGLVVGRGFVEKKPSSNGKRVLLDLNFPPLEEDGESRKLVLGLGLVCS